MRVCFNKGNEILHAKRIQRLLGDESHSIKSSFGTRTIVPGPQGPRSPYQNLVMGVVTNRDFGFRQGALAETTGTYTEYVRIFEDKQRSIKEKVPLLKQVLRGFS